LKPTKKVRDVLNELDDIIYTMEKEKDGLLSTVKHLTNRIAELERTEKSLQKKNHSLAKAIGNAKDACRPGYKVLGWHWPPQEQSIINLPGMIDEFVRALKDIDDTVDSAHNDDRILADVRQILEKLNL
jgi:hypothetical protein